MNTRAKEIVKSFYEMDIIHNLDAISQYLHPDVVLEWDSSFGFNKKDYQDIKSLYEGMSTSFGSFRCQIDQIVAEGNSVVVKHAYFVKTIENPDEKEEAIAYLVAIWELKEDKLFKGYLISQQADLARENL